MKTNFDKWKEGLTPSRYASIQLLYRDCNDCPELKVCACRFCQGRKACAIREEKCYRSYLRWANAPAKEEE